MDHAPRGRQRRQVFGDATNRANEDTGSQRGRPIKSHLQDVTTSSPISLPHNESLAADGTLNVRHPFEPTPENKRLSAVMNDEGRPRNTKRDSEISNASTTASGTRRRHKTYIGPWHLGPTIGRGGCSRVRKVRHSVTGEEAAAKIISKATAEQVRALSLANLIESAKRDPTFAGGKVIPFGLEREICIMKLLDHPNIVRLHDVWENRNELYLIMEYVEGGELFHYIGEQGSLREIEVVYLFRQIVAALLYCHRLNIHHRDLKPENILINKNNLQIKLVDFGMAALQPEGKKLTTPCGSPHYAAPEVIRTEAYDGGKADVWSCGVILFVMLTGSPPFNYSGHEADLKHLFRAIARAEYIMPKGLSHDAQDLIARILVPDPNRRLTMENIWNHSFMHKYDAELRLEGEKSTIPYWIGPLPQIEGWVALERGTIDREILRYLRTLWHSEKEEVLIKKLLSEESNQQKYFYSALLKYRDDSLEDYSPGAPPVAYSTSDHHHHVKHTPTSQDLLQLPTAKHMRSQSGYSILNDEHLYSQHSFYDPPSSDVSYDPFRASRGPIVPSDAAHRNVTVHRGSQSGSRRLRPATALGHRTGSSLRMQALRNSNRNSIAMSRNSSKGSGPSTRSSRSRRSITAQRRSMSRSSVASSHWPSSPPIIVRPGSSTKRGASFLHLRRNSFASAFTNGTGPRYTPEQRKFLDGSRGSAAASVLSSPRSTTRPTPIRRVTKTMASPTVPRVRVRKPESPSKYIQNEARKVSTELEKVMDEAFNRSSMGSSICTTTTGPKREACECDTPPTSFCNTRDSNGSTIVSSQTQELVRNRPLPPIPIETPNTFVQRKLAETRAEIAERINQDRDKTEQFNEVLDKLDRLMQPGMNGISKRASSAPTKSPDHSAPLPAISEETKSDGEDRYESYSLSYRAVTDPFSPMRRAVTEQNTTIRLVDQSPTPIAPLNIRKRSGASTTSRSVNEGHSVLRPSVDPQLPLRSYRSVQSDLFAARESASAVPHSMVSKPTVTAEPIVRKKKSSWFRRNVEDTELPQERPQDIRISTDPSRLQIPQAWQGLDDLGHKAPPQSPQKTAHSTFQQTNRRSGRSASSEFPIRNCVTAASKSESSKERKGFLGLFMKKPKEDKGKRPMELGSANLSSSSILSQYDVIEEASGSSLRPSEMHTNWLSRFLRIKPANKILCFQIGRGRVRQDLVRLLRDWQRFGVRDVTFDRQANIINGRVDKNNHLKIKPVSIIIELFVVLEHGRRANLCLARFTQTKGAASSFRRVADTIEDVFRARSMLVEDEEKKLAMCEVLT